MDPTDILSIIQQSINVKAVVLAVVLTQVARYCLPSGDGTVSAKVVGWTNRLLPILPLVFGMLFCGLLERDSSYVMEDLIRGVFSGAMASYSYRMVKVSILGG